MRFAIAVLSVVVLSMATADARHRHRQRVDYPQGYSERDDNLPAREQAPGGSGPGLAQLVPRDWTLQPPEPNWTGKRFMSPDGAAWFALYTSPVEQGPVSSHLKEVAFADGETITYIRGAKDWIAVSGFKGDRVFYRKAVIACAGRSWHQIAFEFPANMRQAMDSFVSGASAAVQNSETDGCDKELWFSTVRQSERPR